MSGTLSAKRVTQLATEIRQAGATARVVDPKRGYSYAAMCGGMESVVRNLVRELAGEKAAQEVARAFSDASREFS